MAIKEAKRRRIDIVAAAPVLFLLVLVVFYSVTTNNFFSMINLVNIGRQISITGIMAIGVTFVILLGEIDLSLAAVLSFTGMIVAGLSLGKYFGMNAMPVWLCIIITLFVGVILGFVAGFANSKLRIPGFMATLAIMYMTKGLMLMLTDAQPLFGLPKKLTYWGSGYLFESIPVIIVVFLAVFAAASIVLKHTVFGRNIYAIGGNAVAARMSGINVVRTKIIAFIICSTLAALAGILMVGRIGSGQVTAGEGLDMQPIAAAVLGGTSLMGGKGSVWGTLLGVLIMGVLVNGLNMLGAGTEVQSLATGFVLFAAVAFNMAVSKKNA